MDSQDDGVRYLGIPGDPPTLWRSANGASTPVPTIRWAGTGTVGWGSVDEASVDAAVSLLHLELGDLAAACEHGPTVAEAVLAAQPAGGGFMIAAAELRAGAGLSAAAVPVPPAINSTVADEAPVFVFTVPAGPVRAAIDLWCVRDGNDRARLGVAVDELGEVLDVDQALAVCRQLRVSPHDLWGPADAEALDALGARS